MSVTSEYYMHIHDSVVSPASDYSGKGVWSATQQRAIRGTQVNEHYGYNGVGLAKPQPLTALQSTVLTIQGQQYKAAPATFQAAEYDEQEAFADVLSTIQAQDVTLLVHGWGPNDLGVACNLETRVYWAKVLNPEHIEFAVFAAGIIKMSEEGSVLHATFYDFSKDSAKGVQAPTGRLTSMSSGGLWPPELFQASPELVNTSPLELG